ncbi:hypothetical protein AA101099_0363 [Neoasaia chiangmaiensis NBRC 101099]|uniref:Uncharacterized protein n=1 Tax=Neoasaia chiangmaiensis TaxID=320497 RepID=A0A1U9KRR0_9PROT|nr:hypothetical protein [Neoasaia chiangmaiensis]AQS88513.1 hypothetical protein A0U93_11845 [Neoasaia chiangmaiensis]GBR36441.1 hypothetical protein AA101099_0363 [Neoasaia chiangmaiensis NBRC 101099]GEN15342.1 hypothetical protein NCH01_17730 [Neoasaia chiangmaiensis]
MPHDRVPHAASSLRDLGRKATHTPKLLTKEEVIRLAEHVLKGGEHATEEEREIARKAKHNPEGVEADQLVKLGERSLLDK